MNQHPEPDTRSHCLHKIERNYFSSRHGSYRELTLEREDQQIGEGGAVLHADTYRRLVRARDFIDQCYNLPIDLDKISGEACLSRYHFLRLFRRAFNKTPHQYLIHRRIEAAKELLSSSGLRVTDVCFEVGFESLGSFSSLFHKHVGHPPITYRAIIFERKLENQRKIPACFLMMYGVQRPKSD